MIEQNTAATPDSTQENPVNVESNANQGSTEMETVATEPTIETGSLTSLENTPTRLTVKGFLREILQTLILALVLYLMIDAVIARVRVYNISMLPTLQPGELLLVSKLSYRLSEPQRGEIVVFHYNPQEDYIKRVIGIPGDEISISDGKVIINGQELQEPYIKAPVAYAGSWEVPADSLFVLGDNRNQSSDSHSWGFVSMRNVLGKALVVYWPPQEMKSLTPPIVANAAN